MAQFLSEWHSSGIAQVSPIAGALEPRVWGGTLRTKPSVKVLA